MVLNPVLLKQCRNRVPLMLCSFVVAALGQALLLVALLAAFQDSGALLAGSWANGEFKATTGEKLVVMVGAGARLKAARAEQQSGASRTAAWEPAQQQATVPKPRRVGRQRAGFKVTDKHVPTAAKFLFDSNGVTLGPKYLATMQVSVKAAEELAKERRKALGVGI